MSKKKRHEDHEEHIDETWLIPYADLLTLLLALFIILFASSQLDSKKYDSIMRSLNNAFTGGEAPFAMSNLIPINDAANATKNNNKSQNPPTKEESKTDSQLAAKLQKEEKDLKELKQSMDAYIKENNMSEQLTTKLDNEKLTITISDRALFDSGSATIKQESQKLAVSMSNLLGRYPGYEVQVAGHTDNIPIRRADFETNWDLSAKRAVNFMKILLNNSEIEPASYSSVGFGEYRPIAENDTTEGRAKNRRVEVSILRNIKATDEIAK
ncbi:flagellar motor protein MotB [Paenibacillus frigoriresistens]|uniref:flagellar motor protein MotB n=1 Tax=Paenibacillus alginolyticus TaxID=59839 RepID=UPI001566544D|nr:flagellar motor protein MotB [Paenibacillus frigoriresistens]NRF90661.1 flagellar motor protein MotB [Paenibacillus frigoriresistens]